MHSPRFCNKLGKLFLAGLLCLAFPLLTGCSSNDSVEEGLQMWIESPMVKVMRDSKQPSDAENKLITLDSAKNEMAFGQFVLRSQSEDIENIKLLPSALSTDSGKEISTKQITVYEVRYIHLPEYGEDYPDALVPTSATSLTKNMSQPIWYEVAVPTSAEPGEYSGKLDIYTSESFLASIDIQLLVRDFEIPETPTMETSFGLTYEYISHWHNVDKDSKEANELYEKYYWYMIEHRMSPRTPPAEFGSDEFYNYVTDPRVTSFVVPYNWRIEDWSKMLAEKGLLEKAYVYAVDEPKTQGDYSKLTAFADALHSVAPEMRFMVPYYCSPEFAPEESAVDYMAGYVNLWCPISSLFNNPEERTKLQERQELGETLWWYVCVGPRNPYANLHIDMSAFDHRILFWQQKLYDVEGFLYWESVFWPYLGDHYSGIPDTVSSPWEDMATVKSMNPNVYGDGALLYPGEHVGIDGPIPSIRFKLAYKGMVDYEYLMMYEELKGVEQTRAQIGKLTKSATDFIRSPVLLSSIRSQIAETIEQERRTK